MKSFVKLHCYFKYKTTPVATFSLLTICHGIDSEQRHQSDCRIHDKTLADIYLLPIVTGQQTPLWPETV